jgi:hypothetical protein
VLHVLEANAMPKTQVAPPRKAEHRRSRISGTRKDEFIRCVVQDIPDLDRELAEQVAQHLSGVIEMIHTDSAIIEHYKKPAFNPNAFSAMKFYRTSGEAALRGKLNEICESRHLQEFAKAQQISLPRNLRSRNADPSALRDAIVKGVAKRHEDWQAAS